MEIMRAGSRPSGRGPGEWFTGAVRIDPLFEAPDPARVAGAHVTFEPGARTAWHTHPLGQTVIVTSGLGPSPSADPSPTTQRMATGAAVAAHPQLRRASAGTARR